MQKLTVLVYKRTHKGDPGDNGLFGESTCMGQVRDWPYDAVIGIGGKRPWPEDKDIALKVNWVGVTPNRIPNPKYGMTDQGKSWVGFDRFRLLDELGPNLKEIAPLLYNHMYVEHQRRFRMSYSLPDDIYGELINILKLADGYPTSKGILEKKSEVTCGKRRCE
jgi:hypothetical protein